MPRYKHYDYDQDTMVVVNFRRQILPGSLEWAINHIVDHKLNLAPCHARLKNDDVGASAYDPAILLKIILLAYARGILSSRQIARACEENITFMALAADSKPHFTTIASFLASMGDIISPLFSDVLLYCDELGLIHGDMFAVDGCKLPSNAGKQHSGTHAELADKRDKYRHQANKLLSSHQQGDRLEDAGKLDLRQQQKLKQLQRRIDNIDTLLSTQAPRRGGSRNKEVKSNTTDNDSAKMATSHGVLQGFNGIAAVDQDSQVVLHASAIGQGPENDQLMPMLDGLQAQLATIGKPDLLGGAKVTADSGFHSEATLEQLQANHIDGYIADNQYRQRHPDYIDQAKHQQRHQQDRKKQAEKTRKYPGNCYPPTDFVYEDPNDHSSKLRCPNGFVMNTSHQVTDKKGRIYQHYQGGAANCRGCTLRSECIRNPAKTTARQVRIQIGQTEPTGPDYIQTMKDKIDSPAGRAIYSKRLGTVEPVFGNHRNHGRDRFTLRGRRKVNAQWQLYNLVHNIGKCHSSGKMAA